MSAVRWAGRVTAGLLPAAALARLGVPALAAAVFLAVLALGAACWVIASGARSDRVTRMIYARHGNARSLPPGSPAAPARASRRKPTRSADGRRVPGLRAIWSTGAGRTSPNHDAYQR
jgi:hypothetical protein